MKIIAHRGASREFPENTLEAFMRAIEIGVHSIETDLIETEDGRIVLHHDETCIMDGHKMLVRNLTYSELKNQHPSIPALEEILAQLGCRISFCLEIKTAGLAAKAVEVVQKFDLQRRIHFTSFLTSEVLAAKKLCPQAEFSMTYAQWQPQALELLRREGIKNVSLSAQGLTRETVQALLKEGLHTRVYTVNDPAVAKQMASWGVDAVFTDDPLQMREFLKKR